MDEKARGRLQFAVVAARAGKGTIFVVPDDATEKVLLAYARSSYADFDRLKIQIESLSRIIAGNSGAVVFIDEFEP